MPNFQRLRNHSLELNLSHLVCLWKLQLQTFLSGLQSQIKLNRKNSILMFPYHHFAQQFPQLPPNFIPGLPYLFIPFPLLLQNLQAHQKIAVPPVQGSPLAEEEPILRNQCVRKQVESKLLRQGQERKGKSKNSQNKKFAKDKPCPVADCPRKYSSRIALRAHLRNQHPAWYEQTSDYEP